MGSIYARCVTKGINGYYYIDRNTMLLCYYDLNTETSVPLCNQPQCNHTISSCYAKTDYLIDVDYLQYHNGNLYAVGKDCDNYSDVCIYRISEDGRIREKVGLLFSLLGSSSYSCVIHRDYAYFAVYKGGIAQDGVNVYRLNLSGEDSAEVIYTTEPQAGSELWLSAYGNYLYMQHSHYSDSQGNGYTGELYRYNIHDGKTELVHGNIWRAYVVDADNIYYDTGNEIVIYNIDSGEESVLVEIGMPVYMAYCEGFLYYDNGCGLWLNGSDYKERTITVMDLTTMSKKASIPFTGEYDEMIGADGDNILAMIPQTQSEEYITPCICMYNLDDSYVDDSSWKNLSQ